MVCVSPRATGRPAVAATSTPESRALLARRDLGPGARRSRPRPTVDRAQPAQRARCRGRLSQRLAAIDEVRADGVHPVVLVVHDQRVADADRESRREEVDGPTLVEQSSRAERDGELVCGGGGRGRRPLVARGHHRQHDRDPDRDAASAPTNSASTEGPASCTEGPASCAGVRAAPTSEVRSREEPFTCPPSRSWRPRPRSTLGSRRSRPVRPRCGTRASRPRSRRRPVAPSGR